MVRGSSNGPLRNIDYSIHCHDFQVHSGPDWQYLLTSNLLVKWIYKKIIRCEYVKLISMCELMIIMK